MDKGKGWQAVLFLYLVCHLRIVISEDDQFICKRLEESAACNGPTINTRRIVGPPGNRGSPGIPGAKGEKGDDAVVDYEEIQSKIDEKLDAAIQRMDELLQERVLLTQTIIQQPGQEPQPAQPEQALCNVKYGGKCFWVEVQVTRNFTYDVAQLLCNKKGGRPAGIHSAEHEEMIISYLRANYPRGTSSVYVWIGMIVDKETSTVMFNDGRRASYVNWWPEYPSSDDAASRLAFAVYQNEGVNADGPVWNQASYDPCNGILCVQ